jgi:transcriptional regulator with XRE-family HTH domain
MLLAEETAMAQSVAMDLSEKLSRLIVNQEATARAVGVKQPAISKYCSGKARPSLRVLIRLARSLGTSLDYLLDDSIKTPPPGMTDGEKRLLRYVRETGVDPDDAVIRIGRTLRKAGEDGDWTEDMIRRKPGSR